MIVRRIMLLLLALLLLTGFVSCAKEPVQVPARRLEIEQTPPTYSPTFLDTLKKDLVSVTERWLLVARGVKAGESERAALRTRVERDVLPILLGVSLYEEECAGVLAAMHAYCDALEAGKVSAFAASCHFYSTLVSLFGTARAGEMAKRAMAVYLSDRVVVYEERYRTYGYEWYLADAERYRALLGTLDTELAASDFAAAMSVLSLCDVVDLQQGVAGWPAGLLLSVWQWQAAHFDAPALCARKWELMGEMLSDVQPSKRDTALKAEIGILQDEGRFSRLCAAMPELLELYCAAVGRLDKAELSVLLKGSEQERAAGICRALLACEKEFFAFTARLETLSIKESAAEPKAIKSLGLLADCDAFLSATAPLSARELWSALAACAADGDAKAVWAAQIGYLRGVMPYLAYAIHHEGG